MRPLCPLCSSSVYIPLMPDNGLTQTIISAAIEVYRLLGPGLLESAYEECFCHELHLRKLNFERQRPIPAAYKAVKLESGYRLDLLVEAKVIVELKSVNALGPLHEAIILTYMRSSGHHLGLLINFNVPMLKDGIRRYIL
jgi:GxxExxY protein